VKNFWYLFAAYMVIWTAIFSYVLSLSRRNRELQDELHDLQAQVEQMVAKRDAP
jgi:CcmD family protein